MGAGISTEKCMNIEQIKEETRLVVQGLLKEAQLEKGDAVVVGCSSSEVASHQIGSYSSEEIGKAIFETLQEELKSKGIYLAAQCCEHLNRALIVEKEYAKANRLPMVNVMPVLKAGGSFATAAFAGFEEAVAIETICAQAGIDIGDTLIGMHLAPVAVPVRTEQKTIGNAHVVTARTRLKYIGGERAQYI
ncbi:MAG: TIGR01440 family protein [Lachnospiraceae bacterium]|nr:TIGR01440 family protein [Lachnospiraceae bacterium]